MAVELHVGTAGGNKQVTELHVGTSGGNVELTELWVGTAGGNKQIFAKTLAAPTGVLVTTLSTSSLRVTWNAVTGAAAYLVQRSPIGAGSWSTVQDTASLTWDDTGLPDGTAYDYRVIAYLGSIQSDPSASDASATYLLPPSLTSAARNGSVGTSGDLAFTDGGSGAEDEIRIYVSTTGSGSGYSLWATTGANDTAETITGLPVASQVWVKLRNYNSVAGESADSSVLDFSTAPAAPSWATGYPEDNAGDDDGVDVKLLAAAGATSYDVYYRVGASMGGDPTGTGTLLGNFTAAQIVSDAYLHDTGQPHGTVVYYQARARDAVGPGAFGSEASATVQMRVPGAPTIGTPSNVGATATVSWTQTSPDNETLYRIEEEFRTSPSGTFGGTVTFTNPGDDTNVDRTMIDGREYRWRVRAENAAGNSSYSSWSTGLVYKVAPGVPGTVNLAYDGTNPDSELVLSWTAPSGTVDAYDIEIVPYADSFTGTPTHTAGAGDTSKRLTGLGDDARYKARIRATNVWGDTGTWSGDDNEWTAPATPGTPTWESGWPKATADDTIELEISTTPYPADADELEFYGGGALLATQASETYAWTGRSANTQYTGLKVRAKNTPAVGSPHSAAFSAYTSEQSRYTLVAVPQSFDAARDGSACPLNQFDVAWSNNNGDGVARSETMTLERDDGSGYAVVSASVTAGATSYRDNAASATTVGYRLKYNSESSYATDTSLGPPCPE